LLKGHRFYGQETCLRFMVFWDWMSCPLAGETNIPEKPVAPTLKTVQAGSCN